MWFEGDLHGVERLPGGDEIIKADDVLLLGDDVHRKHSVYALLGVAGTHVLVERNLQQLCQPFGDACGEVLGGVPSLRRGDDAPIVVVTWVE